MQQMTNHAALIPEQWRDTALNMAAHIKQIDKVIVSGHVNPDGDALGALATMGFLLKLLGKEFILYSSTGVPEYLGFLKLPGLIHTSLNTLPFRPEAALVLDCNEAQRVGDELASLLPQLRVINIDHHLGHPMQSEAAWIEPGAAATAQMAAYIVLASGYPLQGAVADAVALGVVTDTGGFAHGNADAHIYRLAALLSEAGCDISGIREKLDNTWTAGHMRLWAHCLSCIRLEFQGRIALCTVTLQDLRNCGAVKDDLEGLVEMLRRIRGVEMAALLREDAPSIFKLSMRSRGAVDVRAVAATFGGGGHRNAAGGTLRLDKVQAEEAIIAAAQAELVAESGK